MSNKNATAKPMTEGEQLAAQDRAIARVAEEMAAAKPEGGGEAWAEADMERPWGAEAAALRHLAADPALNSAQSAILRHCAKRIESTAGIQLRALADMLDPALQAGVLRAAADALPATPPPSSAAPEAVTEAMIDRAAAAAKASGEKGSHHSRRLIRMLVEAALATPAQPAVQGGGSREVVFLVEAKFPDGSTRWLTAKGLHKYRAPEFDHWTTDANSACRFLRRGYAEKVVQEQYLADEHHAFVTEHMWIGGPAEDVDPPGNPANSHPQPAVQPASADLIALAKRLESAMLSSNPEAIGDVMVVANELRTAGNAPAVQGERGWEARVLRAAEALCKHEADECGIDEGENWATYHAMFTAQARIALGAADAAGNGGDRG